MIRRPGYGDHLEATVDPEIRSRQEEHNAPPGFEDAIGWLAQADPGEGDHWHVTYVAFALEHPAVYRLMYSPSFAAVPSAAREALRLLREVLDRAAAAGRLRVDPGIAAQTIMSANVGVALSLVTQPETYTDPGLSTRVRDAVHARVLVLDEPAATMSDVPATALQLSARLRADPDSSLTPAERAVLHEWLGRLASG